MTASILHFKPSNNKRAKYKKLSNLIARQGEARVIAHGVMKSDGAWRLANV